MSFAVENKLEDLIQKRRFDEADRLLKGRIHTHPEDADAHYLMGVSRYFQGQIPGAVHHLRMALQHEARHTDAAICLSVLLNDIGKYDEARKVFETANQSVSQRRYGDSHGIDKKFAVKHLELADLYFRYRRYDEAIEEYGKAAILDPSTYDIRIRRAKAYAKKGFLTRAIQELQQLKQESPSYLPAKIQLGLLHYSQGNVLDAELEWEAVLKQDPSSREALTYLEMARENREL